MKGRNYLIGLVLLMVWFAIPCQTKAFTPVEATVKNKGINVRSNAGTDSSIVSSLAAGSKIQVYDAVNGNDGHTWYVVYINGKTRGFVRGDLITVSKQTAQTTKTVTETTQVTTTSTSTENQESNTTEQSTTVQTGTGKVNGTGVRVRSLTSTSSSIVTTVKKNKKITLLNKTTGANLEGNTGLDMTVSIGDPTKVTNIRVELYKRGTTYTITEATEDTEEIISYNGITYERVDLANYLDGTWKTPEESGFISEAGSIEYMFTEDLDDTQDLIQMKFEKAIKQGISTGEYKLVFKAYHENTLVETVRKTFIVTQ